MKTKQKTKTFSEWNSLGFNIVKGSKAIWVDGSPMFTEDQVREKTYLMKDGWESATDENCSGGPMYGIYGNC